VTIDFHPQASAEVASQAVWYDDRREGLGDEFLTAVDDAISLVVDGPERWPLWPNFAPARRCLLSRFPFALAYVLRPDRIVILAVTHTHREPGHWMNRIEDAT
jgi:toxin ParE1/3/4